MIYSAAMMIVMKFGGSSVASVEHFDAIAAFIAHRYKKNKRIAIVVSAMGSTTDELIALAHKLHPNPPKREQDMLISVGERVSIALLAMALDKQGREAVSFTGSQSGIITTQHHTEAKILSVKPHRLLKALDEEKIVIVAGFQGVSKLSNEITTLGRGGSDTSAVALAVALGASHVEFYKDVAGIGQNNPKTHPDTPILKELSYEEALLIARQGAKVLHPRAIELARKNGIALEIRPYYAPEEVGTVIRPKETPLACPSYEEEEALV